MQLQFAKMHGLGNDFMVARWPADAAPPSSAVVRRWADRRLGVGFDQLLLVETGGSSVADARYRIYNADGGEVAQCGNGVRCVARFLLGDGSGRRLVLDSRAGTVEARVRADGEVDVNLGEPDFSPASLPFEVAEERERYLLRVAGEEIEFGAVSLGNPHIVIAVDSVEGAPVGILGPKLAVHTRFPNGVNVGFMHVVDEGRVDLRVYERGVGETLACGTGAAAAVAVGRRWGRLSRDVKVGLPGGMLKVSWPGPGSALWLSGPATWVYEGSLNYEPTQERARAG
jgi:diaminopimelate epimerase